MGLVFHYGNVNKTNVKTPYMVSRDTSIKRVTPYTDIKLLTPQNRRFLQSLGLTVNLKK